MITGYPRSKMTLYSREMKPREDEERRGTLNVTKEYTAFLIEEAKINISTKTE